MNNLVQTIERITPTMAKNGTYHVIIGDAATVIGNVYDKPNI